jgi:photosystem II stability/assembly factor-like uncharacterized protein
MERSNMRRLLVCLSTLLLSLATITGDVAGQTNQWSFSGLKSLYVQDLKIDPLTPSTLYAKTSPSESALAYTYYKSTDGGNNWAAMALDLSIPQKIRVLAIDPLTPSTIYAGVSWGSIGGGVFKSTDAGVNWMAMNNGLVAQGSVSFAVNALAIDPLTPSTLYAGVAAGFLSKGVFKSTDAGINWMAMNNGLVPSGSVPVAVNALAIDPQTPSTLYAGTSSGIFKSPDAGINWMAVNIGMGAMVVNALAIDPQTPSTLYAASEYLGVFKSTDAGGNWAPINNGLAVMHVRRLAVDPQTPSILYASTDLGRLFKSADGGASWSEIGIDIPFKMASDNRNPQASLAIDPFTPTTLYVSTRGGVFKSIDAGSSWAIMNHAYTEVVAVDPFAPSTLYAGGAGVFRSTDAGTSWSAIINGLPTFKPGVDALSIDPLTPSTLYANTQAGVFKSTDAGGSWAPRIDGTGIAAAKKLVIDPLAPSTLYLESYYSIYQKFFKSTDGGTSWFPLNSMDGLSIHFVVGRSSDYLVIDPFTPSTLYAARCCLPMIYKSTDAGASWTEMEIRHRIAQATNTLETLAVDPLTRSKLYAVMVGMTCELANELCWDNVAYTGVLQSLDGGESWTVMNDSRDPSNRSPGFNALAVDRATPSTLYAGTIDYGVYKSANGGQDWTSMNAGLAALTINALAIDPLAPHRMYAATDDGVYVFVGESVDAGGGGADGSGGGSAGAGDSSGSGGGGGGCFITAASP